MQHSDTVPVSLLSDCHRVGVPLLNYDIHVVHADVPHRQRLPQATEFIYPAGIVFVRCGWVAEATQRGGGLHAAVGGATMTYENPLAERPDIETAASLMPPLPHITIDRMLRKAADRIGGKVSCVQMKRSRQLLGWSHDLSKLWRTAGQVLRHLDSFVGASSMHYALHWCVVWFP